MISYKDKTFCISKNCSCSNKLTDDIIKDAQKWWGNEHAPIAIGYLCGVDDNEDEKNSNTSVDTKSK